MKFTNSPHETMMQQVPRYEGPILSSHRELPMPRLPILTGDRVRGLPSGAAGKTVGDGGSLTYWESCSAPTEAFSLEYFVSKPHLLIVGKYDIMCIV